MKTKEITLTPEEKLQEISTDLVSVEKRASKLVVATQEDYNSASKFLVEVIKPRLNKIEELQKFFTEPHREARRVALARMNEIEAMFDEKIKPLSQIEMTVKKLMGAFKLEEEKKARAEEERKEKIRLQANAKREEKGVAPIQAPIATVTRSDATIKTEAGRSTAKKVWKFEILDVQKLPLIVGVEVFKIAFEKGIVEQVVRRMVNDGVRSIDGVRIYEDFDISVKAN